jgi:hypothetical protein
VIEPLFQSTPTPKSGCNCQIPSEWGKVTGAL